MLIFLYTRKELSGNESAELEAWRKLSKKNEEAFQRAIDPEAIRVDLKALEESRLRRLAKKPAQPPVSKRKSRSVIRRVVFGTLKVAAILVGLVIIISIVIINHFNHPAKDPEDQLAALIDFSVVLGRSDVSRGFLAGYAGIDMREDPKEWLIGNVPRTNKNTKDVYFKLFTSEGNRLLLNFTDSTEIWFNSNATIKYPSEQFTDSIRIFLTGETYVRIPNKTKHVYVIKISPPVDNSQPSAFREAVADKTSRSIYVSSRGGEFYLKAYFGEPTTTVSLISGSLSIDSVAGKSVTPITLKPGEQAKLDSGKFQIKIPDDINEWKSWRNQ